MKQSTKNLVEAAVARITKQREGLTESQSDSKDTTYGGDTRAAHKHVDAAVHQALVKGYKSNHSGHPADIGQQKSHKNPDLTFHYAMGDDMPHAVTVHAGGAAVGDEVINNKRHKVK